MPQLHGTHMNKSFVTLFFGLLVVCSIGPVLAGNLCESYPDPENHTGSVDWTDKFGETVYSLVTPCKVFISVPFTVAVRIVDRAYPSAAVAWSWSILDTAQGASPVSMAGGGEDWTWLDENGEWTHEVTVTYTQPPVNHAIEFSFIDFGHGSGTHGLEGSVIAEIIVGEQ